MTTRGHQLRGKRILIASPQPWDHISLSKHHYARELAARGNTVYFLDPPAREKSRAVAIETVAEAPGIFRVTWSSAIPLSVRYHARPVHDVIMRRKQRGIARAIGAPLDVVWSFEFNLFSDLRAFGAGVTIFHPVDPLSAQAQFDVARSADAVLCVSETIRAGFSGMEVPSLLVNHGLAEPFAKLARNPAIRERRTDEPVRIGYSGNLLRPEINRKVLRTMIEENPLCEFHFWGPREGPHAEGEAFEFIRFLDGSRNVVLHGRVDSEELAAGIWRMDCFVLAYDLNAKTSDRSNSHKVLEYLSTGKVVVSSLIATYASHCGFMLMPDGGNDDELPRLLRDAVSRLDELNSPELQQQRRALALENTYARQIDRIDAFLAGIPGGGQ